MNWETQIFEEPQKTEKNHNNSRIILPKKNKSYYITFIQKIISIILNIIMIILFGLIIFRITDQKDLLINNANTATWAEEKEVSSNNKLKLKDFRGYESISKEMNKLVNNVKKKSTNINNIPRGMLLYGPPGTGKTYLAKCLAGELQNNATFFVVNGSDFIEKFVGVGSSRVRNLFETAKKTALEKQKGYFFIFIDEIDSIGKKRSFDTSGNSSEMDNTLNALISEIDGFNSNNDKNPMPPYGIVIGSTNRAEILDNALVREGRLGKKILLDYPTKEGIKNILEYVLNKNKDRVEDINKILQDDSLLKFLSQAQLTASDINSLIKVALESNQYKIKTDDLLESFHEIKLGPKMENNEIIQEDKDRIAIHELGHAVISKAFDFEVSYLNIEPRGSIGGYTLSNPKKNQSLYTRDDYIKKIIILLGGRAAELSFSQNKMVSSGSSDDLEKAKKITLSMVEDLGMWDKEDNKIIDKDKEKTIIHIINESYKIAKKIIEQYTPNKQYNKTWTDLYTKLEKNKKLNKEDFLNKNFYTENNIKFDELKG